MARNINYWPASLPSIEFVEVVSLAPSPAEQKGKLVRLESSVNPIFDALERSRSSFLANGQDAEKIAELYRQLPPAMEYRCHHPPYGLKFHLLNSEVVSASLCWECNNAAVWFSNSLNRSAWFAFDGESPSALALLNICQKHLPM